MLEKESHFYRERISIVMSGSVTAIVGVSDFCNSPEVLVLVVIVLFT